MKIGARVQNSQGKHEITLQTNEQTHSITIPPKSSGFGSSANGGELLFLALATCFCNDLYREADKRGICVKSVQVEVNGEFGGEGEPAKRILYGVRVAAQASDDDIHELIAATDRLAEIQNTLRLGIPVELERMEWTNV